MIDLLFPRRCVHCRVYLRRGVVCRSCAACITLHDTFFCGACRARIGGTHRVCHKSFPYLLGAAADYSNPVVKDIVHEMKFSLVRDAGTFLGTLLGTYAASLSFPSQNGCVIPLPLSRRRMRERGFNQSEIIANSFAAHIGVPLERKALLRTTHTKPQSALGTLSLRRENVAGCFSLRENVVLRGKTIFLVDDVVTSGATLYEAAMTLKKGGVQRIYAFVAAKT